ncbi:MAG: energy transducer TonB [Prevotellaceae bacterium]|nr:energy transducer TonB [Prevotellaceae bacterium]
MKNLFVLICSIGLLVNAQANSELPLTEESTLDTVMPTFQGGGIEEFQKWVEENREYPSNSLLNHITGKVEVQFTVDTSGNVINVALTRRINRELSNEAVRVVSASPKWTPGTVNGKPVQVTHTVPVVFGTNDTPPMFRGEGSIENFRKWVVKNIQYPEFIAQSELEGRVVVRFTVNSKGKVVNEELVSGSYFELNDAVLHAVRMSPKWEPATKNGKPVNTLVTLPVIFRFE